MNDYACGREQELVRLVLSRRWPDAADEGLRAHVDSCAACADAVAVAALLERDREEWLHDAHLPAAGQVWWRAALRAHAEGARAARRPMLWLQGIAASCATALVAALLSIAWPSIHEAGSFAAALRPDLSALVDLLRRGLPILITVLACLIVTPIVIYWALSDE